MEIELSGSLTLGKTALTVSSMDGTAKSTSTAWRIELFTIPIRTPAGIPWPETSAK
jgi:hypothetical protein